MKKILFLLTIMATAFGFAQSIAITPPASVGVTLQPPSGQKYTITYSVTSADPIYIQFKKSGTLCADFNIVPAVTNGTLTTIDLNVPNSSISLTVGDVIDIFAKQFEKNNNISSPPLSVTIQAALVPYITLTPPATADILLNGATAFTAKYYSTSSKPIYIDGKRGGVNGDSYGSWTINSPVLGVETTITLAQLNSWNPNSITLAVGDKLILRADQYGGTGPIPTTTSAEFTIVSGSLGTNSFEKSTIAAYPNPVVDVLTLAGDSDAKSYKVVDITGKTVLQNIPAAKSIDLSALKTGQYFLISDKNSALRLMKL
jgi:Secretion system C-terminal sorting domain